MRNKILIGIIVLILAISGGLALFATCKKDVNPKKIVSDIVETKSYKVDITYTTKNSRGEFTEDGNISHDEKEGTKITLKDKEQIFTKDKIKINYFEGNKTYTVDRSYDEFYRFFLFNELPQYINKEGVQLKTGIDDEKNKIILTFKTDSKNQNFDNIKFIVDSKAKTPESLVIYDINGKERVVVKYNNFLLK